MKVIRAASTGTVPTTAALLKLMADRKKPVAVETKAASAARSAAQARTRGILEYAKSVRFNGWPDLESQHGVTIPEAIRSKPYSYLAVLEWARWYEEQAIVPIDANRDVAVTKYKLPTADDLTQIQLGAYKLRPRQRKAAWQAKHVLFAEHSANAVLNKMNTGSGKTIFAADVIRAMQENKYFGLGNPFPIWNIVYVVPKAVEIKTKRTLIKAGIKNLGSDVHVVTYSGLRSQKYKNLFEEVEEIDLYNGDKTTRYRWTLGCPALVIFDECHNLKRRSSTRTKLAQAFICANSRFIFMSATPAVVAEDLRLFIIASRIKWRDEFVDTTNWRAFAYDVTEDSPDETSAAGMKRLFEYLGGAVVDPPADPRKVKAYNGVKYLDFRDAKSRAYVENAQNEWLRMCRKFGKEPDPLGQQLVAFTNFRRAVELVAAPQVVDLMLESHAAGKSPILMVSYMQSIKVAVAELARRGIPRSKISIIQGGQREIKESDVMPLNQWIAIRIEVARGHVIEDRAERTRYNKSTEYHLNRMKAERSLDDQRELDKWSSTMKLHKQSAEQRQDEIDNFLEGRTEFCLATLAAGGTGIDLDHQVEGVRPRELFAMPCYYAEEFIQAFGRAYREFTLSDVYQWVVLFRDTIVTQHVAPILARKLKNINSYKGDNVASLDLEAELTNAAVTGKIETAEKVDLRDGVLDETAEVITQEDEEDDEG